jgi:serine phosphatase RsbU (regulator of sigma subunit)
MSDVHPEIIGTNVSTETITPRISSLFQKYMPMMQGGTGVFEEPEKVLNHTSPPSIITIEPIEFKQFAGTHWWIGIASGLSEVDAVVNHIFGAALFWAIFVVVSVCAILLSTGTQLIRARLRLERVEHQVLEKELNQAREIQLNWLPTEPCCNTPIDVAAVNRPANRISGDFYNWFALDDGRTVVAIGDVTGHGMAAAFLMATTQLLVRSTMMRVGDPGECLEEVNRQLCTQGFNGQFVTMSLLVLDTKQHTIQLATAGHPAPLFADGEGFRRVEIEPELVLGVDPEAKYPTQRLLLPGDARILLYTDGVVDAATAAGARFSMKGLMDALAGEPSRSAQAMVDSVTVAVDRFLRGHDLSDDLTLVAIQLRPTAGNGNGSSATHMPRMREALPV